MLAGIYSLLIATVFVLLDAVDVAFTKRRSAPASPRCCSSARCCLTDRQAKPQKHRFGNYGPMLLVVLLGAALVYTTLDPLMPHFGDAGAPAQGRLAPEVLADSVRQVGRDARRRRPISPMS